MKHNFAQLDKSSKKYICPSCGKRSFVYYLRTDGGLVDEKVGRCDREDNCAYHYPPRFFYQEKNPDYLKKEIPKQQFVRKKEKYQEMGCIPLQHIFDFARTRNSNFVYFLLDLFDWETVKQIIDPYFIGCTKQSATVFPQIDEQGKCRTAKVQDYNKDTGKRIHDNINWLHAILKKENKFSSDFNLQMCLFGLHLIRSEKNKGKTVCICESEKSAIIASALYPDYLWMAAGALHWLSVDKLLPLKDWDVILFPDTSKTGKAFEKWNKVAEQANEMGLNVVVSTLLEDNCTLEQKEAGFDIGDYLIYVLTKKQENIELIEESSQKQILETFKMINPNLDLLINCFDLELDKYD